MASSSGKDADDVGAPPDLAVDTFERVDNRYEDLDAEVRPRSS